MKSNTTICTISLATLLLSALFGVAVLSGLLFASPERRSGLSAHDKLFHNSSEGALRFITLNYGGIGSVFDPIVAHNCRTIQEAPGNHTLTIYTEDLTNVICNTCKCLKYQRANCSCVYTDRQCAPNMCEKLYFLVDLINTYEEFAFIDRDLLILKDSLLPHFYPRTRAHDFLANYAQLQLTKEKYHIEFNTGLFFIRRLPNINYSELIPSFYRFGDNNDQSAVTWLIHTYYSNWDILSFKFHCRWVIDSWKIPYKHCYTVHDNGMRQKMVDQLGFQYLKINQDR